MISKTSKGLRTMLTKTEFPDVAFSANLAGARAQRGIACSRGTASGGSGRDGKRFCPDEGG